MTGPYPSRLWPTLLAGGIVALSAEERSDLGRWLAALPVRAPDQEPDDMEMLYAFLLVEGISRVSVPELDHMALWIAGMGPVKRRELRPGSAAEAEALRRAAVSLLNRGLPEIAVPFARLALEEGKRPPAEAAESAEGLMLLARALAECVATDETMPADEAEEANKRCRDLIERLWGGDDPRLAPVLLASSRLARVAGKEQEAERLEREARTIAIAADIPPGEWPPVLPAPDGLETAEGLSRLEDLADDRWRDGDDAVAETLTYRALALHRRLSGEGAAGAVAGLRRLALIRWEAGRFDEAAGHSARLRAILERHSADGEVGGWLATAGFVDFLVARGRGEKEAAFESGRLALELANRHLGPGDSWTKEIRRQFFPHMAEMLPKDRVAEAVRAELSAAEAVLGPNHGALRGLLQQLVESLPEWRDTDEIERLRRRLVELSEVAFGPESLPLAEDLVLFGQFLVRWRRYAEAEPPFRRAVTIAEAPASDPLFQVISLDWLATAINGREDGNPAEAETLFRKALDLANSFFGPEHPETLVSRQSFGAFLWGQGRLSEAREEMEGTLAAAERALGADHHLTQRFRGDLVRFTRHCLHRAFHGRLFGWALETLAETEPDRFQRAVAALLAVAPQMEDPDDADMMVAHAARLWARAGRIDEALRMVDAKLGAPRSSWDGAAVYAEVVETLKARGDLEGAGRVAERGRAVARTIHVFERVGDDAALDDLEEALAEAGRLEESAAEVAEPCRSRTAEEAFEEAIDAARQIVSAWEAADAAMFIAKAARAAGDEDACLRALVAGLDHLPGPYVDEDLRILAKEIFRFANAHRLGRAAAELLSAPGREIFADAAFELAAALDHMPAAASLVIAAGRALVPVMHACTGNASGA